MIDIVNQNVANAAFFYFGIRGIERPNNTKKDRKVKYRESGFTMPLLSVSSNGQHFLFPRLREKESGFQALAL